MKATVTQVEKRITILPNKTDGILNYDIDNAYSNRVKDIVNSSGVASACVSMKTRFLIGGGFKDKAFYKAKVNRRGMTADRLLRKIAINMSYLPMIGVQVNYNSLYQKTEVNYIPFDHMRLTTSENEKYSNMVALYDDWQKITRRTIDKEKIDYVHFYNPDPVVIQSQVDSVDGWGNYKGQVYFYSPDGLEYPLAVYDSVLEDMQTDSKTKAFKFRNVTTNFMASHILITDEIEDEDDLALFTETITDYQGADDCMKIMHIQRKAGSDTNSIELKKVEIQDVEKLYEFTESSVRDAIILNFLIPPALFYQSKGLSDTGNELKAATAYYNGITAYERLIIEEIFKELFSNFATPINPTGDYSIIPFKASLANPELTKDVFQYVTKNQILESYGLPEVKEEVANEKPLYEALGVGGLQSLSDMLANPALTYEQKLAQLKVIYKLPDDEAIQLMGGPKA